LSKEIHVFKPQKKKEPNIVKMSIQTVK